MTRYSSGSDGLLVPIEQWLQDMSVSEILINCPQEVWVEKGGTLTAHSVDAFTELHLRRLFQLIANENHQRLSPTTPLLSGSLSDGSRIQCCLPPTAKYPTLSIRRQVVKERALADYENDKFYQSVQPATLQPATFEALPDVDQVLLQKYHAGQWAEFIALAIDHKKTIVISGGTSSGKTTYLNACLRHIDQSERLILLEDTREMTAPHKNQVQLLASKGEQGEAAITMQDLVQCCLRLRPDRIIMGEIRGKEVMDFVSACSTGHDGSMTTIHANHPRMAFMRMTQMYKLNAVPSMTDNDILNALQAVIDIIIQVGKTVHGRIAQSIYYRYGELPCPKQ